MCFNVFFILFFDELPSKASIQSLNHSITESHLTDIQVNGEDGGVKSISELMRFVDSTEEIAEEKLKTRGRHAV
ncbi:hypothetical protein P5673_015912 [Acropora cervicornis]|uniref:Uncharacterized protein n=1 Tax=Acropora cervicornis TaxID=6130 RepID=A0AAD9V4X6_ACRCE|nr:hypothetical protein P5673_015912 [Acropora cervicornis]